MNFTRTDITDFGQVMAAFSGINSRVEEPVTGIVHLGAIASPGEAPDHVIFEVNMKSTYNVFEAARRLDIRNVVWASSETVYGIPYAERPGLCAGRRGDRTAAVVLFADQAAGREDGRAVSACGTRATKIVGLRFSNVQEPQDYANFAGYNEDPRGRHFNLWTYIDARDAAQAIRLSLEAKLTGAHVFGIANSNSVMSRSNDELLDEVFPGTKRKRPLKPNESLISIEKAQRVLGYKPQYRLEAGDLAPGRDPLGRARPGAGAGWRRRAAADAAWRRVFDHGRHNGTDEQQDQRIRAGAGDAGL